jgi:hypothetical protein
MKWHKWDVPEIREWLHLQIFYMHDCICCVETILFWFFPELDFWWLGFVFFLTWLWEIEKNYLYFVEWNVGFLIFMSQGIDVYLLLVRVRVPSQVEPTGRKRRFPKESIEGIEIPVTSRLILCLHWQHRMLANWILKLIKTHYHNYHKVSWF